MNNTLKRFIDTIKSNWDKRAILIFALIVFGLTGMAYCSQSKAQGYLYSEFNVEGLYSGDNLFCRQDSIDAVGRIEVGYLNELKPIKWLGVNTISYFKIDVAHMSCIAKEEDEGTYDTYGNVGFGIKFPL